MPGGGPSRRYDPGTAASDPELRAGSCKRSSGRLRPSDAVDLQASPSRQQWSSEEDEEDSDTTKQDSSIPTPTGHPEPFPAGQVHRRLSVRTRTDETALQRKEHRFEEAAIDTTDRPSRFLARGGSATSRDSRPVRCLPLCPVLLRQARDAVIPARTDFFRSASPRSSNDQRTGPNQCRQQARAEHVIAKWHITGPRAQPSHQGRLENQVLDQSRRNAVVLVRGAVALDCFGDGTLLQTAFVKPCLTHCRNRRCVIRVEIMTRVKRENVPPCQFRGIGNSMTDRTERIDLIQPTEGDGFCRHEIVESRNNNGDGAFDL